MRPLASYIADQGPKPLAEGRAVASTGNPIVTETAIGILAAGGNAADAAVAAALVQAVVEPHLTSHAGMVSCLYWDGASKEAHQLNALGTLAPDLAPFRPINGVGGWAREGAPGPQAAIPGFMPGLKALHERFGSKAWAELCAPAIRWAEEIYRLRHIVMPAAVLSLATVASWSRFIRSGMIDVLNQDYIRTAYAKGRSEKAVLFLHALRNAMIPAVTVIAVDFVTIISGAVITETVFAWPGIGRLFMESMDGRDYPMLMGLMMMGSLAIVVANIVADLCYAALDPRIRYD